jgi:hypothetical protein
MQTTGNILAESENFILCHEDEYVELQKKLTGGVVSVGDHFGDPTCGLIARDERWCASGGEGLVFFCRKGFFWTAFRSPPDVENARELVIAEKDDLLWLQQFADEPDLNVHAMRRCSDRSLRILLDPWSSYASTWRLNIRTKQLTKLCDGPSLSGQPMAGHPFEF